MLLADADPVAPDPFADAPFAPIRPGLGGLEPGRPGAAPPAPFDPDVADAGFLAE